MDARDLIAEILRQTTRIPAGNPPLAEVDGWDSLKGVRLVLRLEELTGREVSEPDIEKLQTIDGIDRIFGTTGADDLRSPAIGHRDPKPPHAGQPACSAAKAGIEGLTRTMAAELGAFGVRVNAVALGFIDVSTTRAAVAQERLQHYAKETPLGRLGGTQEVIEAVELLASNAF